jgi:hypothetical protein
MQRAATFGVGFIATLAFAGLASATTINAVVTADNHYSLYSVGGNGALTLVGGNELGSDGNPGDYNWSVAETWSFDTTVFIGAWSDDFYAQGLLGEFRSRRSHDSRATLRAEVFSTGIDIDDFAGAYPSAGDVTTQIGIANATNGWRTPVVDGNNGVGPWGTIAGISNQARWMWANPDNVPDPFGFPGYNAGEYLIFCVPIPSAGTGALAGLGLLVGLRRKR